MINWLPFPVLLRRAPTLYTRAAQFLIRYLFEQMHRASKQLNEKHFILRRKIFENKLPAHRGKKNRTELLNQRTLKQYITRELHRVSRESSHFVENIYNL